MVNFDAYEVMCLTEMEEPGQKKTIKDGLGFLWKHGSVFLVEEVQNKTVYCFFISLQCEVHSPKNKPFFWGGVLELHTRGVAGAE